MLEYQKKVLMSIFAEKMMFSVRCTLVGVLACFACVFAGCRTEDPNQVTRIDEFDYTSVINNHLTLMDFAVHLHESGIKVEQVQPLRADVLRATDALAIMIGKDEIGAYYFNTDVEQQRNIIAKYHKDGFAYILGFRFPVFMAGSFVLTGVEKHPQKKEIVKALRSFK